MTGVSLVCRTCLGLMSENDIRHNIDDENGIVKNVQNIREMLNFCVPEVDSYISLSPSICNGCLNILLSCYNFKIRCLRVENAVKAYVRSNNILEGTYINLGNVVKSQIIEALRQKNWSPNVINDYILKVEKCLQTSKESSTVNVRRKNTSANRSVASSKEPLLGKDTVANIAGDTNIFSNNPVLVNLFEATGLNQLKNNSAILASSHGINPFSSLYSASLKQRENMLNPYVTPQVVNSNTNPSNSTSSNMETAPQVVSKKVRKYVNRKRKSKTDKNQVSNDDVIIVEDTVNPTCVINNEEPEILIMNFDEEFEEPTAESENTINQATKLAVNLPSPCAGNLKRKVTLDDVKEEILLKKRKLAVQLSPKLPYLHKNKQLVVKIKKEMFYKCDFCEFSGTNSSVIKDHLNESHFVCKLCDMSFKTKNSLNRHLNSSHLKEVLEAVTDFETKKRNFKCFVCKYVGISESDVKEHRLRIHLKNDINGIYKCPFAKCDVESEILQLILEHIQLTHHSRLLTECPLCNFTSPRTCYLKVHVLYHEPKNIICPICNLRFRTKFVANKHMEIKHNQIEDNMLGMVSNTNVDNQLRTDEEGRVILNRSNVSQMPLQVDLTDSAEYSWTLPSLSEMLCTQALCEIPASDNECTIVENSDDCLVISDDDDDSSKETNTNMQTNNDNKNSEVIEIVCDDLGNNLPVLQTEARSQTSDVAVADDPLIDVESQTVDRLSPKKAISINTPENLLSINMFIQEPAEEYILPDIPSQKVQDKLLDKANAVNTNKNSDIIDVTSNTTNNNECDNLMTSEKDKTLSGDVSKANSFTNSIIHEPGPNLSEKVNNLESSQNLPCLQDKVILKEAAIINEGAAEIDEVNQDAVNKNAKASTVVESSSVSEANVNSMPSKEKDYIESTELLEPAIESEQTDLCVTQEQNQKIESNNLLQSSQDDSQILSDNLPVTEKNKNKNTVSNKLLEKEVINTVTDDKIQSIVLDDLPEKEFISDDSQSVSHTQTNGRHMDQGSNIESSKLPEKESVIISDCTQVESHRPSDKNVPNGKDNIESSRLMEKSPTILSENK